MNATEATIATDTGSTTPLFTILNSLSQGCVIVVITSTIIVFNVINIIVWSRIGGITPATKLILLNLSVSDVLVGVVACAPAVYPAVTGLWPFGDFWCQISGLTHSASCTMSVWCISMIGIDRYVAVIWPFCYQRVMSLRNVAIVMATLWTCAVVTFAVPIFTKPNFVYYRYVDDVKMCGLYWEYQLLCIITAVYVPIASAGVITFTAVRIYVSLNKSNVPQADNNRKALRKLVASAVVFFVCLGPYVTIAVMTSFVPALHPPTLLHFWTLWLANSNSFLNVFVYSFSNRAFRQDAARLFRCKGASVAPAQSTCNAVDNVDVSSDDV